MASPLISVVTVCLNAERYIEQTIQSVLGQSWQRLEYIIVDGGSTDKTVDIINRYREHLARFVSEKDEGIADAMNKGLALARGDYVLFLQADDYLQNSRSLELSMGFLDNTADLLACGIQYGKRLETYYPRWFHFWTLFKQGLYHQGTLCRRLFLNEMGGFDKQFRIAMDYDFFLRAYQNRARLVLAPVILSVMRDTGISSRRRWTDLKVRFAEERRVHEKNCSSALMGLVYRVYWFLYLPYRRARYLMERGGGH